MANKVTYGITNVYYSIVTETLTGGVWAETYATPVRMLGARAISLSANSENTNFPADNNPKYFTQFSSSGYEGTLTMAILDDQFREEVLGETKDTNNNMIESVEDTPKVFALLFQFEGDDKNVRHVMYRCTCGQPDISSNTKDTTIEPNEIAINISCAGRLSDGKVKARVTEGNTGYSTFFSAVYVGA